MSDRYQLQSSIVYSFVVMESPETGRGTQIHISLGAPIGRSDPLSAPPAAVDAGVRWGTQLRPVAGKGSAGSSRDCVLHRGVRGGVASGYLLQEVLTEVQNLSVSAVLEIPQPVGVDDAHIE